MKILFCGYRDWAKDIYTQVYKKYPSIIFDRAENNKIFAEKYKPDYYDLVFFVGWSWKVDTAILQKEKCFCLHPSKLPLYRGGSPIQNQIIDGVINSAVTIFLMDEHLDHGPVVWQHKLSLTGDNLCDIFQRIVDLGTRGYSYIIEQYISKQNISYKDQEHNKSTVCKRRTPVMSEIKHEDFQLYTATELYNKIRCLQDPYPNAYIKCKDDTILYVTKAKIA